MEMNERINDADIEQQIKDVNIIAKLSKTIIGLLFFNMQKDLRKEKIGIIIDDTDMEIEWCNDIYGDGDNLIYCLGTSKITPQELQKRTEAYSTIEDWNTYLPKQIMYTMCEKMIKKSKENKEKCKSFKNIKYIDTSENREEVLNQILEEIEEKI